jgi:hypothetical protein
MATTSHLMAAGKLLGIPVLDHFIVTRDSRRWYSIHERGTPPRVAQLLVDPHSFPSPARIQRLR